MEMSNYCAAYEARNFRKFPAWTENAANVRKDKQEVGGKEVEVERQLDDDSILYLHESYIVTEFIHGKTLKLFMTDHPLPFPEVAEMIAQIPEVSEVYSVTGEFDLVAMVRVRSHEELADVIPGRLNKVPGVSHTETHIAFRTYSRHDLEAAFSLGLGADA